MGLKWHVKWDPLIIKVSFKCKFVRSEARGISLILKFGLHKLTTKAFSILPQIVQLSTHITQHLTLYDSVCMKAPTVTSPAVEVHLWIYIRSRVILRTPLSLPRALKSSSSFLPHPSLSLRSRECDRRNTSAPLQWADCPVHPPGDSSRC